MTFNDCFMCSDKESLAVGTELLVFGKEIMSHVIYKYSILTNTWTSGMQMNSPRCLFGSATLGEVAVIAGGCDPSGQILNSAEIYNSETGEWTVIPSMNKARKMCSRTGTITLLEVRIGESPHWRDLASEPSGSFVYNCAVMGC